MSVAMVAGEASGDLLASLVLPALRAQRPQLQCAGIAGDRMIAAGCEPWFHVRELSVRGYAEVLRHLPRLLRLRRKHPIFLIDTYWTATGEAFCPAAMGLGFHIGPQGSIEICERTGFTLLDPDEEDPRELHRILLVPALESARRPDRSGNRKESHSAHGRAAATGTARTSRATDAEGRAASRLRSRITDQRSAASPR